MQSLWIIYSIPMRMSLAFLTASLVPSPAPAFKSPSGIHCGGCDVHAFSAFPIPCGGGILFCRCLDVCWRIVLLHAYRLKRFIFWQTQLAGNIIIHLLYYDLVTDLLLPFLSLWFSIMSYVVIFVIPHASRVLRDQRDVAVSFRINCAIDLSGS